MERDRAALPPDHAFVLRFAAGCEPGRPLVAGRVEHVVSGRGTRFGSYDEAIAFMAAVLAEQARADDE